MIRDSPRCGRTHGQTSHGMVGQKCFLQWSSDHGFLGKPRKIKARKNVIVQEVTVESHENPMLRESTTNLTKTLGCTSTLTSKPTLNEFCFKIFCGVKYTVWPATGTGK